MRCRRGKDQAFATLGKEVRQFSTLTAIIGNDMTLIDNDNVPAGLFDIMTELRVVL